MNRMSSTAFEAELRPQRVFRRPGGGREVAGKNRARVVSISRQYNMILKVPICDRLWGNKSRDYLRIVRNVPRGSSERDAKLLRGSVGAWPELTGRADCTTAGARARVHSESTEFP